MKKAIITLIMCSITLLGCSNTTRSSDSYIPNKIDTTGIVSKDDYLGILQTSDTEPESDIEDSENYDNIYSASEIQLTEQDNSIEYTIDNQDINYDDKVFIGLNDAINRLESPYDKNTLINFIIKTYKTDANQIYAIYSSDTELIDDEGQDVGASITVHESLQSLNGYVDICNKYNDTAVWTITLLTENTEDVGYLHGCKSFIIYQGSEDKIIDMSLYDTSTNNIEGIASEEEILTEEEATETFTEVNNSDIETYEEETTLEKSEEDTTEYVEN